VAWQKLYATENGSVQMSEDVVITLVEGFEVRTRYFEDLSEACEAAREGCALFELPWLTHLVVTGAHARRFVHNMTTCQIKELQTGEGRFGMSVDSGGKLVADFFVDAEADRLIIESSAVGVDAIAAHLKSHIIADRVVLAPESQGYVLALTGEASRQVLSSALEGELEVSEPFGWAEGTIAGRAVRVRRNGHRLQVEGWDLTVAHEDLETVRSALLRVGATRVGHEAYEVCRVLAGVPRVPSDMDSSNVPLEAQTLYDTIDWDKGCYIGQEVIAMMHYRGRPNRHLRALAFAGEVPAQGSVVTTQEGREVGTLGTVVKLPVGAGSIGLAVIKRKHAELDTVLEVSGHSAKVLELPLV
jgi:tRNA-modifying protein YgfZ